MKIDEMINELVRIKQEQADLAAKNRDLAQDAARLEGDIMKAMSEAGTTKAATTAGHSVTMNKKIYPAIEDWAAFYRYVEDNHAFDLLHKRLSNPSFRDRWEAGEVIPGTSQSEVWELALRTVRN